jgi:prepilin-type N-terminal cleavage/methylation domain-containing protein
MDNPLKSTLTRKLSERDNLRDQRGFTLVEILVSIAILTVIMAGMFTFLWGTSKHWTTGRNLAEETDNARIGLNRMTRELKQSSQVTSAQSDQVSFRTNFGSGDETITYGFTPGEGGEPGKIWRSSSLSPDQRVVIINGVESYSFTFFGNDYKCDTQEPIGIITWGELQDCSTSPAAKIARVDISITLRSGNGAGETFVEQAWLRNRTTTSS